jgi:hypothetical protein
MIKIQRRKRPVQRPKFADERWTGPEPRDGVVITDSSDSTFGNALNWYNYYYDADKAREWILEYMESAGYTSQQIKLVRGAPSYKIVTTAGWIVQLLFKEWTLPESSMMFLANKIDDMMKSPIKDETPKDKPKQPSPRERMEARAKYLLSLVDDEVDLFMSNSDHVFSCYTFLKTENASPVATKMIQDFALSCLQDLAADVEEWGPTGGRKNVKEYKKTLTFYQTIDDDCSRYLGNKKTIRKPRKVKEKPVQKLIEKLNYQKEFPPLKIVSINPADIIGANQLWTYNTKTKKLTKYDSVGPAGLQVKGASIIGFDVDTSSVKRLRKPDETIQQLLKAGKVTLRKFMDEVKTIHATPNGRINTDTILLRVIK